VVWVITSGPHDLRSGTVGQPDGLWVSGLLMPGDAFALLFNAAGTYPYYDARGRGEVTGTITVLP
jgi:hypothetical protein